jgi:SET domain-containing protein 6
VGNAALLHRYGFTEPNNPFDIVNIDMELLLQWSSSSFSDRYCRTRLALWRKLDYCGCVSQDTEYFEISSDGEPQIELLILLYIMLLPEDTYHKLDLTVSTAGNSNGSIGMILSEEGQFMWEKASEVSKDLLLTKDVCDALLSLADMRESFYGSNSIEDDIEALGNCCIRERKLYHSLMLRVSERRILERLRTYAAVGAQSFRAAKRSSVRKKLKKRK